MTIANELSNLQQDITNARTAITNKGGTVTVNGGSSQLATDIGTITELKGETITVTPTTSQQTITPSSGKNGITSVTVNAVTSAIDSDIQSSNILSGVNILGITGNVTKLNGSSRSVNLTSSSQTFYPASGKNAITSITVSAKNLARTITPTTSSQSIGIQSGYSGNGTISVNAVTSSIDANIVADNIKKDIVILGITGTYEGGGGGGGTGYNLEYLYHHSGGQNMSLTINGVTTYPLVTTYDTFNGNVYSRIIIPNVTTVNIDSDDYGYQSDCTVEYTVGGSTTSVPFGTTLTLTQDAKLRIIEGDCLLKGTLITMANGSFKEISKIELGDKVMSVGSDGELTEDEVIFADGDTKKYNDNYDLWEFENGYEVRTTHHHRFYNVERQAFVYLDEFKIGEHTINKDGEQLALLKHTNMVKTVHHFTLATKNYNNYFANGLLSGNRNSTEIHLGTEEQKQVESRPSEAIGKFL